MGKLYTALLAAAIPAAAMAQSAIDAQQISQSDFKGTARFMSMGGAFTALGGDLSTLGQNPAGIGVYRSSEVGATLGLDFQSTSTSPSYSGFPSKYSQTKASCNNVGYIGVSLLDGPMRSFNWGVSYGRAVSFDRVYRGYVGQTNTSLTNYIASYMQSNLADNNLTYSDLEFSGGYNPYYDTNADWLGILAYNSYMINPTGSTTADGLFQQGTVGDAMYNVREQGYVDEYNISFGGNFENIVYWGVSVGITDLNYTRTIGYSESMENARIHNVSDGDPTVTGNAYYDLQSRKYINGTGWNLKFGLILKPINEFRIGLAVHTPTWYNLNQGYDGVIPEYRYFNPALEEGQYNPLTPSEPEYTENANFDWHYRSPWRIMAGVAGVIGGKAIVSLDYQYDGYNNMSISTPNYYNGYATDYQPNEYLNQDIKSYFTGTSTIRLGLEYRVTPQFSVRAGYNVQTSNVKGEAKDGSIEILTSGTDPSYSFDKNIYNITCGLGYKYKNWYIDAAYIYRTRESVYHAYTNFNGFVAPQSKITDHNSQLILSTGFKF
ncbi:MAG: hypothetical protein NC102_10690 [Clostridium sp.]|nr:hypothetical protein [Clostridium sp.]